MTWYVEQGIGEERAVLLDGDRIVAARLAWPGELAPGLVADAVLVSRPARATRGLARFDGGSEALVDRLPPGASEGAPIRLEVMRPAMAERGRHKRAQARPTAAEPRPAPSLAEGLGQAGETVRIVPRFPECGWDDLIDEALGGETAFAGGSLTLSATPAMTLIDVDGPLPPAALALAAATAAAQTIRRLDLGGSVGIDFPTLAAKSERQAVDAALSRALASWPHERTAMNGFGLVQLVARLERVSLLHRAAFQRAGLVARRLLRRAEGLAGAGAIELSGDPALGAHLAPAWLDELARRSGREVRWRDAPGLALAAPHAQLVPR